MCSWAASSSSVNGRTWDRAHLITEPRYAIQTVANVLLITTPGAKKRWLVFWLRSLHVSETREVVQRAVRPCSVSLRGAGLVSNDVCDPMPGLPVGQCVSIVIERSLRLDLLLHNPKQHLPSEEDSCRKHVGTHCTRCR